MLKSVLHLVNQESIILESVKVAKYGLSKRLGVPVEEVKVRIAFDDGKIKPEFLMSKEVLDRLAIDDIKKSMAEVWEAVKEQMAVRLEGLSARRYG